jgi:hypothetical protein
MTNDNDRLSRFMGFGGEAVLLNVEWREQPAPDGFDEWWNVETKSLRVDATHRLIARMAWDAATRCNGPDS